MRMEKCGWKNADYADRIPADGGCGWENADGKMRTEKCEWKNADGKMRIEKKNRTEKIAAAVTTTKKCH